MLHHTHIHSMLPLSAPWKWHWATLVLTLRSLHCTLPDGDCVNNGPEKHSQIHAWSNSATVPFHRPTNTVATTKISTTATAREWIYSRAGENHHVQDKRWRLAHPSQHTQKEKRKHTHTCRQTETFLHTSSTNLKGVSMAGWRPRSTAVQSDDTCLVGVRLTRGILRLGNQVIDVWVPRHGGRVSEDGGVHTRQTANEKTKNDWDFAPLSRMLMMRELERSRVIHAHIR